MIIWIGGAVVHGKGWYGKSHGGGGGGGGGGGIVIQDMLTKGSGKHVMLSPNDGCKDHFLSEAAAPKGGYMASMGRGRPTVGSGTNC